MHNIVSQILIFFFLLAIAMATPSYSQNFAVKEQQLNLSAADEKRALIFLLRGAEERKKNNHQSAAKFFRTALFFNPKLKIAREALVVSLARSGELQAAKYHLRILLRLNNNPQEAQNYLLAIQQITKEDPIQISGIFLLLPTSNVSRVSSNLFFDTILGRLDIIGGGEEESGIGVRLGGTASYEIPMSMGKSVQFSAGLTNDWYKLPELRHLDLSVAMSYKTESADGDWAIRLFAKRNWYGRADAEDVSDRETVGISLSGRRYLSDKNTIGAQIGMENRTYIEKDHLSGPFQNASLTYSHFDRRKISYNLALSTQRYRPHGSEHLGYKGIGISAGIQKNITNNIRVGLDAGIAKRFYDTDFPTLSFPREDESYVAGVSVQNDRIKIMGLIPNFKCSYRVNSSNVALYEFKSTDCKIALIKQF